MKIERVLGYHVTDDSDNFIATLHIDFDNNVYIDNGEEIHLLTGSVKNAIILGEALKKLSNNSNEEGRVFLMKKRE